MQGVRDVVERRVNLFGVSEPVVQISGNDRLIVDLAGIHDVCSETKGHTPTKLNFVRACIDALQTMSLVRLKEGDVEQLCLHVGKAD